MLCCFVSIYHIGISAKVITPYSLLGEQVEKYNDILNPKNIQKGDIIKISKNEIFLVEGYLSSGNRTYIFKVKDLNSKDGVDYALRLPKYKGDINFFSTYTSFLTDYISGAKALLEITSRAIKVKKSRKSQYVLVDLLGEHFTLAEYLEQVTPDDSEFILEEFRKFIKETISIYHISDMHLSQIVYDKSKQKWMMIDWGKSVMRRSSLRRQSHFLNILLSKKIAESDVSEHSKKLISNIRNMMKLETRIAIDLQVDWMKKYIYNINKEINIDQFTSILKMIPRNQSNDFYEEVEKKLVESILNLDLKLDLLSKKQLNELEEFSNATYIEMKKLKSMISLKIRPAITCKDIFNMIF